MNGDTSRVERSDRSNQTNRPSVIISDVRSPELDGMTFLKLIRSTDATADIPVIIISGTACDTAHEARESGATAVLQKPYDPKYLQDLVIALYSL